MLVDAPGALECDECPLGAYSPAANSGCLLAPAGTYVGEIAATRYELCEPGTFSGAPGADACELCGPGNYAPEQGATACKPCPPGTGSKAGAVACTPL